MLFELKEWHRTHARNIPGRILALKERVDMLDRKAEQHALSEEELYELRSSNVDIHSLSRMNTSISWQ